MAAGSRYKLDIKVLSGQKIGTGLIRGYGIGHYEKMTRKPSGTKVFLVIKSNSLISLGCSHWAIRGKVTSRKHPWCPDDLIWNAAVNKTQRQHLKVIIVIMTELDSLTYLVKIIAAYNSGLLKMNNLEKHPLLVLFTTYCRE